MEPEATEVPLIMPTMNESRREKFVPTGVSLVKAVPVDREAATACTSRFSGVRTIPVVMITVVATVEHPTVVEVVVAV